MSGHFEIFNAPQGGYRFRLLDSSGNLLVTSGTFPDKPAAAAGIAVVREIAGTGLIRDTSRAHSGAPIQPSIQPKQAAANQHGSAHFPVAADHVRGPAHRRGHAHL
ncbi:YegP family protein [Arthrobacter sp. D1-17]